MSARDLPVPARAPVPAHVHDRARAGDPSAQHRIDSELPTVDGQALEHRDDLGLVGARVEKAAEGHVTGDAGEAVEPRDRAAHRRRRATAKAAP